MPLRRAVVAWLGVFALALAAGAPASRAQTSAPAEAVNDDAHDGPSTVRPALDASRQASASRVAWSQSEIDAAHARCQALLTKLEAVTMPAEPIREGDCGAPAPIQLISLGVRPQVALSPPPTITCELAAALAKWLQADVQPAAREMLGGPVVRLEIMSSYSCRNAYARAKTRLSEHGRANALDIARFVTERGDGTAVLADWGLTERDVRKQIAAAQATEAKLKKEAAARQVAGGRIVAESGGANSITGSGPDGLRGSITPGDTAAQATTLGLVPSLPGTAALPSVPSLGLTAPSKLGGPTSEDLQGVHQRFLHRIHAAGCARFGTILGPEANDAHRNHFHVDMAERQGKPFCE